VLHKDHPIDEQKHQLKQQPRLLKRQLQQQTKNPQVASRQKALNPCKSSNHGVQPCPLAVHCSYCRLVPAGRAYVYSATEPIMSRSMLKLPCAHAVHCRPVPACSAYVYSATDLSCQGACSVCSTCHVHKQCIAILYHTCWQRICVQRHCSLWEHRRRHQNTLNLHSSSTIIQCWHNSGKDMITQILGRADA
jgi:hypothetical protein